MDHHDDALKRIGARILILAYIAQQGNGRITNRDTRESRSPAKMCLKRTVGRRSKSARKPIHGVSFSDEGRFSTARKLRERCKIPPAGTLVGVRARSGTIGSELFRCHPRGAA
jgi:hypothetical protein